jgi:polyhydroxyalkanoate synthesis repressor PhaR
MPLIKRYPNRKLYDTEAKRYVTLEDIAALIREERDVRVVDNESGEDVTSLTLTQIILEQEKKSSGYLPSALLTGLIRSGGSTLDHWRQSVERGVASLGGLGRGRGLRLEESANRLIEQGKLSVEQAQNLLRLDRLLSEVLHSLNVPTHRDIRSLQDQIEALSARLGELSTPGEVTADAASDTVRDTVRDAADPAPPPSTEGNAPGS